MSKTGRKPLLLSAEHLYSMDDDCYQFELDRGRLVVMEPPGFPHGVTVARVTLVLATFVEARGLGAVVTGDTGFVLFRSPDTVRGPDVAFVRAERLPTGEDAQLFFEGAPDLAVEVLSPSNRPGQLEKKVRNYLSAGSRLVWVIDPRTRTAVVHAPDAIPRTLTDADEIEGGDVLPGFRAPVRAFFERVP
jgi:Uma2 family endonuclease